MLRGPRTILVNVCAFRNGWRRGDSCCADAFTVAKPNVAWVTDITYLHTNQGWLYLAVILDLFSRRIVGWATRQTIDCRLALSALDMTIQTRRPGPVLVHHSDRGSTYTADAYRKALRDGAIECSMSRKGDCWDNAVAESFFATLKRERHNADAIPLCQQRVSHGVY